MSGDRQPLLRVEDLRVHFPIRGGWRGSRVGTVKAVDGITLEVKAGETVALVGESGCGKSTAGNAILGLVDATSGKILFEGRDILAQGADTQQALRRDMQVIFQDPVSALNPKLSVGRCIAEPLTIAGYDRKEKERRVDELLELVGLLPAHKYRYPNEMSGGQRQRVVIARALALSPKLLVCDEPVSALDVSIRSQIINLLIRLQEELDLSYLFIAHDLSVVRHIADRVVVMYLGTIVEEGSTDAVFEHPTHPYTEALLAAIPLPDPRSQRAKPPFALEGDLPSLANPPKGCPFLTRCPIRIGDCATIRPVLADTGWNTKAACLVRLDAAYG